MTISHFIYLNKKEEIEGKIERTTQTSLITKIEKRVITHEQGRALAEVYACPFFEYRKGANASEPFEAAARGYMHQVNGDTTPKTPTSKKKVKGGERERRRRRGEERRRGESREKRERERERTFVTLYSETVGLFVLWHGS